MRFLPESQHTCHVCGTRFAVKLERDPRRPGPARRTPSECPSCQAPLRHAPPVQLGRAKGLLLVAAGMPAYVAQFGDTPDYLRAHTRTEAEVDAYVELVRGMDRGAWLATYPTASRGSSKVERETVRRMSDPARFAELNSIVAAAAESVKAEWRAERERHLGTRGAEMAEPDPFVFSISGPDARALFLAIADSRLLGQGQPTRVWLDTKLVEPTRWRELAEVMEAGTMLRVEWKTGDTACKLTRWTEFLLLADLSDLVPAPELLVQWLGRLPFELAVFAPRYSEWYAMGFDPPEPAPYHLQLGLAIAMRGPGLERVCSRRWLDHGPWAHWSHGDLSVVFFHDPDAGLEEGLRQAMVSQAAFVGDTGPWIDPEFQFDPERGGLYDPEKQELIRVFAHAPEARELLEMCAARSLQSLGSEKPIRSLAVVMPEPALAERWVHEMWLRDIELRTFVEGVETSLTASYRPPDPTPPAWARALMDALG